MNHTMIKRIGCAILVILILTLCGCGLVRQAAESSAQQRAEMDDLLSRFMFCVESNDAQGAAKLAADPAQMLRDFPGIAAAWPARGSDQYTLRGTTVNISFPPTEDKQPELIYYYLVSSGGEDYQIALTVNSFHPEDGIVSIRADRIQDLIDAGIEPEGSKLPIARKTPVQWLLLVFWGLSVLFCIYTIIDVLRKKPRLYGLWILIALLYIGFSVNIGPSLFNFGTHVGLFRISKWIKYSDHRSVVQLFFPIGAILYWCLRKTLLKKKAKYAVPADRQPPVQ